MVTFLSGYMSLRAAKLIAYLAVPLLILLAFYLALDAYGDSRYREGATDEREAVREATEQLKREAAASASRADDAAALRVEAHIEQVQEDQERVDNAIQNGTSPLDALFGG